MIINNSINLPCHSMKGILFLYCETHEGGRDSKKFFNPDITDVKVSINSMRNKALSQGLEPWDQWEEIFQHFAATGEMPVDLNIWWFNHCWRRLLLICSSVFANFRPASNLEYVSKLFIKGLFEATTILHDEVHASV